MSSKNGRGARRLGQATLIAWLGFSAHAGAQVGERTAERYQLRWVREGGAESCVSGAALARLLDQVLETSSSNSGAAQMLVEGRAEPADAPLRFRLLLSFKDTKTGELVGERELTTAEPRCGVLTPSVLLVLAMSIDPDAARAGLPAAVADELRREREEDVDVWPPGSEPSSTAAPVTDSRSRSTSRYIAPVSAAWNAEPDRAPPSATTEAPERWEVAASAAASVGILPELSWGAGLGGRVPVAGAWAVSLAALGWLPGVVPVPQSPYVLDDGVDLYAAQTSVALCRRTLGNVPVRLDVCGGAGIGVRWLAARALAEQGNPVRPFFGPELGLEGSWRITSSWFVRGAVSIAVSLREDRFTYRDHLQQERLLYAPSLLSGRASLGLGVAP